MISHEARHRGLQQENICPGDVVEFTCKRSESSPSTVRWFADGVSIYTFVIPHDIGSPDANQTSNFGIIGVLVNQTTLTLRVNSNSANAITNGTLVACGERGGSTSQSISVNIIGIFNHQVHERNR